jgi:uncharacterized protein (DUF2267 family)
MSNVVNLKKDIFEIAQEEVKAERNAALKEKVKVKVRQIMDQKKALEILEAELEHMRNELTF